MRITKRLLIVLTLLTTSGCGDRSESNPAIAASGPSTRPVIAAVNSPLREFSERLGGDFAEIRLAAPATGDPSQWRPDVNNILQLQQAQLLVLNGAGYSGWVDKASLSHSRLLQTSTPDVWIALQGQVTHSHGPEGSHAHGEKAFTTWMDMSLATAQARAIHAELARRWPGRQDQLDEALAALHEDLKALDEGFLAAASKLQGRSIIYSHPVYQYFERRYRLPGKSLHWEPDGVLAEEDLATLQPYLAPDAIFVWEAEPSPANRAAIDALGLSQVVIDPGANIGDQSWLVLQRENLARLQALH